MAKLTKSMKEAIDQLAQQIISSAAYQNFQEKRALLANDPNFLSLYQQLEEKQDMLDKLADSEEDIPDEYLEELEEKYRTSEDKKEKIQLAIEAGKYFTEELMENTNDNTGLIEKV